MRFAATFIRSCRPCRGTGTVEGSPDELGVWINEHDNLVVVAAGTAQAYERGEASWDQVEHARQAVELHRLGAPGDQCEDCNGHGRVPRLRRRTNGRRPR